MKSLVQNLPYTSLYVPKRKATRHWHTASWKKAIEFHLRYSNLWNWATNTFFSTKRLSYPNHKCLLKWSVFFISHSSVFYQNSSCQRKLLEKNNRVFHYGSFEGNMASSDHDIALYRAIELAKNFKLVILNDECHILSAEHLCRARYISRMYGCIDSDSEKV